MFDIAWTELLVIVVITILVVGPKELPGMLRTFGRTLGSVRRTAREFQTTFGDALREAERQAKLDDVKRDLESVRRIDPTADLRKGLEEAKASIESAEASPGAGEPSSEASPAALHETADAKPQPQAPSEARSQPQPPSQPQPQPQPQSQPRQDVVPLKGERPAPAPDGGAPRDDARGDGGSGEAPRAAAGGDRR